MTQVAGSTMFHPTAGAHSRGVLRFPPKFFKLGTMSSHRILFVGQRIKTLAKPNSQVKTKKESSYHHEHGHVDGPCFYLCPPFGTTHQTLLQKSFRFETFTLSVWALLIDESTPPLLVVRGELVCARRRATTRRTRGYQLRVQAAGRPLLRLPGGGRVNRPFPVHLPQVRRPARQATQSTPVPPNQTQQSHPTQPPSLPPHCPILQRNLAAENPLGLGQNHR
ncbi:hypothetical protein CROQUDRAFT_94798 [Cronartium quercuum f. sp. fusiforme G11]|uniref:Uncharacterized protein n=1 Tax=Cronartium quercuum f. sp. fusiforme G11 TaxID=708437 RepID=A0A9P6NJE3_9BASI|nr:hypothetical protein CROQUDRAFT_94798 [Cronartium quercuum f. sp. fusiforme G11]